MHTDNLIINHSTTRQTIEGIAKLFPHLDGEATTTLIVETVDSIDTSAFVITPQKKEVFWVFTFVSK